MIEVCGVCGAGHNRTQARPACAAADLEPMRHDLRYLSGHAGANHALAERGRPAR
jgi:hypothetical protein